MQQDITFTMEIDGAPCQCTVLFTFYSDITKAHYMLYTPDDPAGPAQVRPAISRRTYPSWNPCGMIQTAPLSRALLNMSLPTAPRRLRATAGRSRRKTTVFVILQTCERAGAGHYAIYK